MMFRKPMKTLDTVTTTTYFSNTNCVAAAYSPIRDRFFLVPSQHLCHISPCSLSSLWYRNDVSFSVLALKGWFNLFLYLNWVRGGRCSVGRIGWWKWYSALPQRSRLPLLWVWSFWYCWVLILFMLLVCLELWKFLVIIPRMSLRSSHCYNSWCYSHLCFRQPCWSTVAKVLILTICLLGAKSRTDRTIIPAELARAKQFYLVLCLFPVPRHSSLWVAWPLHSGTRRFLLFHWSLLWMNAIVSLPLLLVCLQWSWDPTLFLSRVCLPFI